MPLSVSGENIWLVSDNRVPYLLIEGTFDSPHTFDQIEIFLDQGLHHIINITPTRLFMKDDNQDVILAIRKPNQFGVIAFIERKLNPPTDTALISSILSGYIDHMCRLRQDFSDLCSPIDIHENRICLQVSLIAA